MAIEEQLSDIDSNFWIKANAGSGKTTQLVNRFLLLLKKGVKPSQILCITYTEAAASEMKERIIKKSNEINLKIEEWQLNISTIHSFCQKILIKNNLFKTNIKILNDNYTFEKIIKKIINSLDYQDNDIKSKFEIAINDLSQNESINTLYDNIKYIIENQNSFLSLFSLISKNRNAITAKEIIKGIELGDLSALLPKELQYLSNYKKKIDEEGVFLQEELYKQNEQNLIEDVIKILGKKNSQKIFDKDIKNLKNWSSIVLTDKKTIRKNVAKIKNTLILQIQDYYIKYVRQKCIDETMAILYFAYVVLKEYQDLKYKMNLIVYDDLLFEMYQVLKIGILFEKKENNYLNIKYLMLDEAQDTNPISWDIIKYIISYTKCKFFVVGDKKQSIYRFQGAKVEEYEKNEKLFNDLSIKQNTNFINNLTLETSYRSIQPILDYVDDFCNDKKNKIAFSTDGEETIKHNSFLNISNNNIPNGYFLTSQQAIIDKKIDVQDNNLVEDNTDEAEANDNEKWHYIDKLIDKQNDRNKRSHLFAQEIAEVINLQKKERDSGIFNGIENSGKTINDIAIIYPSRNADNYLIFEIFNILKQEYNFNISFESKTEKKSIYTYDIISFLNFAILQNDNFNLACLLKSDFFNFDDHLLYEIILGGQDLKGENTLWKILNNQIITDVRKKEKIDYALNVLKQILKCNNIEDILYIIQQLVDEKQQYKNYFNNIKSIFNLYKDEYNYDYRGFLRLLENEDFRKCEDNNEKYSIFTSTIHGVKGMEFDTVIIVDLKDEKNNNKNNKYFFKKNCFWYRSSMWNSIKQSDKCFEQLFLDIENYDIQEEYEKLRLKYVALTRARRRIVLLH